MLAPWLWDICLQGVYGCFWGYCCSPLLQPLQSFTQANLFFLAPESTMKFPAMKSKEWLLMSEVWLHPGFLQLFCTHTEFPFMNMHIPNSWWSLDTQSTCQNPRPPPLSIVGLPMVCNKLCGEASWKVPDKKRKDMQWEWTNSHSWEKISQLDQQSNLWPCTWHPQESQYKP